VDFQRRVVSIPEALRDLLASNARRHGSVADDPAKLMQRPESSCKCFDWQCKIFHFNQTHKLKSHLICCQEQGARRTVSGMTEAERPVFAELDEEFKKIRESSR
jgi:hypothetical protein